MITENQIRQQIFQKIRRIPSNKLNDLADYLNKLEQDNDKSSKALSFAGCWSNMDESVLDEFTNKLMENRQKNSRRSNE